MQLHACLLLFIITTDKTLASNSDCGGNISLDQEPYGHFNLTLYTPATRTLYPDKEELNETFEISNCTWTIDIPAEKTVFLKSLGIGGGWSLSVRCSWNENLQILESGMIALLSGCDNNKGVLTWTGTRGSSNAVQLAYYVQDDERNSWDDRSSHHPNQDLSSWIQKETTITSAAPAGQERARGAEWDRGRLEPRSVPQPTLSVFPEDAASLQPTPALHQGPSISVSTDREAPALPEEKRNNGADTSGVAHLTDTVTPTEQPHLHFHPAQSTEVSLEIPASPSIGTDTPTGVAKNTEKQGIPPSAPRASSPTVLLSLPLSSLEDDTFPTAHGEADGKTLSENQPNSWRSLQNTEEVISSTTFSPLRSFTEPPQWDSTIGDLESSSSSSSKGLSTVTSITSQTIATVAAFSQGETVSHHPNRNKSDSFLEAGQLSEVFHVPSSSTPSHTNPPQSGSKINPSSTDIKRTRTLSVPTDKSEVGTSDEGTSALTSALFTPKASLETGDSLLNSAAAHHPSPSFPPSSAPGLTSTKDSSTSPQPLTALPVPDASSTTLTFSRDKSTTHSSSTLSSSTSHTEAWTTGYPSPHQQPHSFKTQPPSPPSSTAAMTTDHEDELLSTNATSDTSTALTLRTHPPHNHEAHSVITSSALTATLVWSSTNIPAFYIEPDQLVAISVNSFELLLQMVVEDSGSAGAAGLEEYATAWMEPYLQRAPGFSRMLGVWSSGHAVQSLVEFRTSGALQWLSRRGATSLLELTGLSLAVREERTFRSSKITNITVGGLQSDVCEWLLQCPSGYKCVRQAATANYSCSSVCHFDHCHHHGMCTHHPGQLPVCRCLVGEDFWFMGQRCDLRMTRARLVGACLAVLVTAVTIVGVLAFVAVRRYKAILIQAKVDQTRSSYRRFNHFDELSGRFWLRSWADSADSLDNPGFTRSDELLHLRALDRPCCYHDDTLSLASTCASHGTRINTIYPHSSQYGWRGSALSVGDGVMDSGKASDLSVCSWPVEPIHWTPFPLLQQLASHRTPTVRVARPRSYCEGMELVDLGKSWTA